MIHNAESVTSVPIILGVVTSKLSTTQVVAACDHLERICGRQVSRVRFKIIKIENSPLLHLRYHQVYMIFSHDLQEVRTIEEECEVPQP